MSMTLSQVFARSFSLFFFGLCMVSPAEAEPGEEQRTSYMVFPYALRLEGVGAFYGVGARVANVAGGNLNILAAKSFGAVDGYGGALTRIPLWNDRWEAGVFGFNVARAQLKTSYGRGVDEFDDELTQDLEGRGIGIGVDHFLLDRRLKMSLTNVSTDVSISRIRDRDDHEFNLPGANLKSIKTWQHQVSADYQSLDTVSSPQLGFAAKASANYTRGRSGQSDQVITNYQLTGYVPVVSLLTGVVSVSSSDAAYVATLPKYDTEDEVREALKTDCEAGIAPEQERCEQLSGRISRYIERSNRFGTATPMGGGNSLRAYREQRFRAAHTRLAAAELRFHVLKTMNVDFLSGSALDLVVFSEVGGASDFESRVAKSIRHSNGGGIRMVTGDLTMRLEGARGEEGNAWFLIVGNAF